MHERLRFLLVSSGVLAGLFPLGHSALVSELELSGLGCREALPRR